MDNFKFYGSATIGSKGQIVVPADAREELSFKEGDKVIIMRAPHGEGIMVLKADIFQDMIGQLQTRLTHVSDSMKNTKDTK
jgi:AbrB family looped-hinge helix DNA binding protein